MFILIVTINLIFLIFTILNMVDFMFKYEVKLKHFHTCIIMLFSSVVGLFFYQFYLLSQEHEVRWIYKLSTFTLNISAFYFIRGLKNPLISERTREEKVECSFKKQFENWIEKK